MNLFLTGTYDQFIRCIEVIWSVHLNLSEHIDAWVLVEDNVGHDIDMSKDNISLHFIDATKLDLDKSPLIVVTPTHKLTKYAYSRLFMSQFLPADVDKCLYLDTDVIICNRRIKELYDMQFDAYAVCCRDISIEHFKKKELYHTGVQQYFNSGVMLFNMKKIREDELDKKLIDLFYNPLDWQRKTGGMHDQSILNYAFHSNVIFANPCFNVQQILFAYKQYDEYARSWGYKDQIDLIRNAVISHAQGEAKPWDFEGFLHWQQFQLPYRIWQFDAWNTTRKSLVKAYPQLKCYYTY